MIISGAASAPASKTSTLNSTTTLVETLPGARVRLGRVQRWAVLTISITSSGETGVAYCDFSNDGGTTTTRTVQLNTTSGSPSGIHGLVRIEPYYRVRVINGSVAQSTLTVTTILSAQPLVAIPTSRAGQTYGNYSDVLNMREIRDPKIDEAAGLNTDILVYNKIGFNADVAASTWEDIWSVGGTSVTSTKVTDVVFFARQNADTVSAPYAPARVWKTLLGFQGTESISYETYPAFPAKTDIWAAAYGPAGGAAVGVKLDILLLKDS